MFKKQKSLLQIKEEGFVYSSGKEEFWNRYPRVFDRGVGKENHNNMELIYRFTEIKHRRCESILGKREPLTP